MSVLDRAKKAVYGARGWKSVNEGLDFDDMDVLEEFLMNYRDPWSVEKIAKVLLPIFDNEVQAFKVIEEAVENGSEFYDVVRKAPRFGKRISEIEGSLFQYAKRSYVYLLMQDHFFACGFKDAGPVLQRI